MPPKFIVDSPESLQAVIHELIPISQHMGIHVISYDGEELVLGAPLAPNINHQQSGFGGSLFSIAALGGWGILQLKICELGLDCNTVIADGEVTYKRPVFSDYECRCALPGNYADFERELVETGKSRLTLTAEVLADGKVAMVSIGHYVVKVK